MRSHDVSTPTVIAFVTAAIVASGFVAFLAAYFLGTEDPALAAGLGALGGITAAAFGAVGQALLRRSQAGVVRDLIEAASPVHPLMRRLMNDAPGTYVHSLAVANIAEAAALAIGADPLVARVGAYYHDIGKLAQPDYFFENQEDDDTPHDPAYPVRSANIIMAHVSDGVELGLSNDLPAPVVDIIREHHGTSLVRYFYNQASLTEDAVYEADFRYSGSLPRSREAAIVMIADASEASVRAMTRPDVREVEASVRAVVAERSSDMQFAESGITEPELESVIQVVTKQLVSFRHVRCAYPSLQGVSNGECECR